MDQWLVRTAQNHIAGPYTKDQVCSLILKGQLSHQDEVCPANGYWIYLHERAEIARWLGIEVPRASSDSEEITETGTHSVEGERTDPSHVTRPAQSAPRNAELSAQPELEAFEALPDFEQTAVLQLKPKAESAGRIPALDPAPLESGQAASAVQERSPEDSGAVESVTFWRGASWVLVVCAVLLVFAVLRVLRG